MLTNEIKRSIKKLIKTAKVEIDYLNLNDEDDELDYEVHQVCMTITRDNLNTLLKKPITEIEFNEISQDLDDLSRMNKIEFLSIIGLTELTIRKQFIEYLDDMRLDLNFSLGIQFGVDSVIPTFYLDNSPDEF